MGGGDEVPWALFYIWFITSTLKIPRAWLWFTYLFHMASTLQKPHRKHMIKVLLNTTLQPEKVRLKEVGDFHRQMHRTSKPRPLGAQLLRIKSPSLPAPGRTPCQLCRWDTRARSQASSGQPLGMFTTPGHLLIPHSHVWWQHSVILWFRKEWSHYVRYHNIHVCGTLSQTYIHNTDTGMCFKLLHTSFWVDAWKVPGMDFSIHPWILSSRTSSTRIGKVGEKGTERASQWLDRRPRSQRINPEEGVGMNT